MHFTLLSPPSFCSVVGTSLKLVTACNQARRIRVDYIIAGTTALILFAYLIYALLRPERF